MATYLPVFYSPKQVAQGRYISPSPGKPALVVADWKASGLPIHIHEPAQATREELSAAHDTRMVSAILACRRENGLGTRDKEVADSLPWTSGSLLSAARHVLKHGGVACSPTSGFHHATYERPSGFCTFNGLMVTACTLLKEGWGKIGIIDCDMHYGNGTDGIIEKLGLWDRVKHWTAGKWFPERGRTEERTKEFLGMLFAAIHDMRDCDLILYQAGADPHEDDPLGGFLSTEDLEARDWGVFVETARQRTPVVWNLAGGYQEDEKKEIPGVLRIHRNTAWACVGAHAFGCEPIVLGIKPL